MLLSPLTYQGVEVWVCFRIAVESGQKIKEAIVTDPVSTQSHFLTREKQSYASDYP